VIGAGDAEAEVGVVATIASGRPAAAAARAVPSIRPRWRRLRDLMSPAARPFSFMRGCTFETPLPAQPDRLHVTIRLARSENLNFA